MKQIHKRVITILFMMILCIGCIQSDPQEAYASKDKKYLVLIQHKDGTWSTHQNIVEVSDCGCLMLNAKRLSKALGFTYKIRKDGTFAIKKDNSIYNIYSKEQKEYEFSDGSTKVKRDAANIAYLSKRSGYNLCCIDSMNGLVFYKCFNKTAAKEYNKYDGIICFSRYKEIPQSVPIIKVNEIVKKPTPIPVSEPTSINIEGVEFPVRSSYLKKEKVLSDWGGTAAYWSELQQNLNGTILDSNILWYDKDQIGFSHQGVGFEGVTLTKTKKGYKISINVKLSGSVLADQSASVVKAMIATISSKPSAVYQAVFDSFTSTNTHGLNKDSYSAVGDCKIKIGVKDGTVSYYIHEK